MSTKRINVNTRRATSPRSNTNTQVLPSPTRPALRVVFASYPWLRGVGARGVGKLAVAVRHGRAERHAQPDPYLAHTRTDVEVRGVESESEVE